MKSLLPLLLGFVLVSSAHAQAGDTLALEPGFITQQILDDKASATPHTVYSVESGQYYALDGRLDIVWPIEIVGPDDSWIKDQETPPVILNTPDEQGAARQFFELQAGGSLVLKNIMMSGVVSTGEIVGTMITNTGGSLYMAHNVAFADWRDFLMRNQAKNIDISITDCIFINGVRTTNSPWGGFPIRMDVAGENVTIENNTVVNSGRLLTNSGPFFNATIHELHNTYLNSTKAGHEQRANEMIQANNIYYNFDFLGRKFDDNTYDSHWTTWNYYSEAADSLDQISLYLGQNLFFRETGLLDWFSTQQDTILPGLLWEHASVDSFVVNDADYTIGTNYTEFDPGFAVAPGNANEIVAYTTEYWLAQTGEWVDWRIPSPVLFDEQGVPFLNAWPPSFDLSYTHDFLDQASTEGLPVGDLNWFPEAKALYMENRDMHIAALRDSIANAVGVYVPGSPTPMITPNDISVSVDDPSETPSEFTLEQNYPNPFNPTTNISFTLTKAADVKLTVYNLLGQKVAVLLDNQLRTAGKHTVQWDGRDEVGTLVSSGMYIYRLEAEDFTHSRKMLFLK